MASVSRPVALLACGSFNPPTYMHLRMFEKARDYVQSVLMRPVVGGVMSPTHDGYGKPDLAPASHRINMVTGAVSTSDWITADGWECCQTSWSRTLQVLDHVHEDLCSSPNSPQLMLLCGADLLDSFFKVGVWREEDLERIVRDYGLIVVSRAGSQPHHLIHKSDILSRYQRNIHVVQEWIVNEISSSAIRKSLNRQESVRYLLPDSVLEYIQANHLYACPPSQKRHDYPVVKQSSGADNDVTDTTMDVSILSTDAILSPGGGARSPCLCKSPDPTLNRSTSNVWQGCEETFIPAQTPQPLSPLTTFPIQTCSRHSKKLSDAYLQPKPPWVYDPSIAKSLPDLLGLCNSSSLSRVSGANPYQTPINHLHVKVTKLRISPSPETTV